MGPRYHLSFCASKTAWLAQELLVSIGPSHHLRFLYAKLRLLDQNYKSLWVPHLTCRLVHAKQRNQHQKYLSLWVPALICGFWMQNSDFLTRITSLYGSQPSSVVFGCKTATLGPELQVSVGPRPHLWFFHAKQRLLEQNNKCLWVPDITCRCVHVQQHA